MSIRLYITLDSTLRAPLPSQRGLGDNSSKVSRESWREESELELCAHPCLLKGVSELAVKSAENRGGKAEALRAPLPSQRGLGDSGKVSRESWRES